MKKNIIIIAVLVAIIGVTAAFGLNVRSTSTVALQNTNVMSLGENTLQPLNIPSAPSSRAGWTKLIASASAEEAAADAAVTEEASAETTEQPEMTWQEMRDYVLNLAPSYLVLYVGEYQYGPYPLTEEMDLPVQQEGGEENILHITPNSVVMANSNCEGQDCVAQGEVTLENMETRILGNMILCLPNQVYIELYSAEMMADALLGTTDPALAAEEAAK